LLTWKKKKWYSKGLLNIGARNIYAVHNAFPKGQEELGEECSDMIIAVYHFFSEWSDSCDDIFQCQLKKAKAPQHNLVKCVHTRWLSVGEYANRLIQ